MSAQVQDTVADDLLRDVGAALQEAADVLRVADSLLAVIGAACEAKGQEHLVVAVEEVRAEIRAGVTDPLEIQVEQVRRYLQRLTNANNTH